MGLLDDLAVTLLDDVMTEIHIGNNEGVLAHHMVGELMIMIVTEVAPFHLRVGGAILEDINSIFVALAWYLILLWIWMGYFKNTDNFND